ncbi:MAG: hypothetical protein NC421_10290 [Lachnospiraceae bacterium]|nr:hypothetical protein [Lachnospiraceae bacterium]
MVDIEDDSFRITTTRFTPSVRLACGSAYGYRQMFPYGNTGTCTLHIDPSCRPTDGKTRLKGDAYG